VVTLFDALYVPLLLVPPPVAVVIRVPAIIAVFVFPAAKTIFTDLLVPPALPDNDRSPPPVKVRAVSVLDKVIVAEVIAGAIVTDAVAAMVMLANAGVFTSSETLT